MKKTLLVTLFVLVIITSILSGTMAVYSTSADIAASGAVIAKEFKLTAAGTGNYSTDVKIAPTETVTKQFTISNFDGAVISETDMGLAVTVTIAAKGSAIKPLQVRILKGTTPVTTTGSIVDGVGTLSFTDELLKGSASTNTYTVEFTWPSTAGDINYAGAGFGATASVSVTGTQK